MPQIIPIFNIDQMDPIPTASYFDFLSEEKCNQILGDFLLEKPVVASIDKRVKDNKKRDTLVHPVPQNEKSEWLYRDIADRVGRYNQFGYQFHLSGMYSDLQLLEYKEGGHYDWHVDIGSGEASLRKLSVIIQLSPPDSYEGGDVIFNTGTEFTLPRKQGTLAIFPSYVLHKVTPVTKGKRYALVAWIQGHERFK